MAEQTRILAADADASVRETIRICFMDEGYQCDMARNGITALKMLRRQRYSLAVIDTELPEVHGLVVCRQLRRKSGMPVILISAKTAEQDRLDGFQAGGNDYLTKPFYPRELVARANNLLRLCGETARKTSTITAGRIRIELDSRAVFVDGKRVSLAPREYDLLAFLAQNPNQSFSRDMLLDHVWGHEFHGGDRTVDSHVKSLRGKLKPFQSCVETVWGYGYRLVP